MTEPIEQTGPYVPGNTTPDAALPASGAAQEERLMLKELAPALSRLPARHREVLVMVALRGMTYHEVAAATGWPTGTAKSRVSRARADLRARLLGEGEIADHAFPAARGPRRRP